MNLGILWTKMGVVFLKVYVEATGYSNLATECMVLVKSFYSEMEVQWGDQAEQSSLCIYSIDDHSFCLRIDQEEKHYIVCTGRLFERRLNDDLMNGDIQGQPENKYGRSITDFSMDKDIRYFIKVALYIRLSLILDKQLPWGILQGIRPVKLVFKLYRDIKIKQGEEPYEGYAFESTEGEILENLVRGYYVSSAMAKLAIEVAKQEAPFMPISVSEARKNCSVYISIPFCPTRCHYCSFPSNSIDVFQPQIRDYIHTLLKEWDETVAPLLRRRKISCLYIGGGTPTSLIREDLEYLLQALRGKIDFTTIREITVEAGRPDTITKDKLMVLKELGVHRISINPQTMHQATLKRIGRDHTVEALIIAKQMAESVGFNRVNMDLILGLPNENLEMVIETLKRVAELNPSEVTVHTLAIKRSSEVHEHKEQYRLPSEKETNAMVEWTMDYLINEQGYKPYYLYRQKNMVVSHENIGYFKGTSPCIYNIEIMEEVVPIIAIGAGAISKEINEVGNPVRSENIKNVKLYMDRIDEMIERKKDVFKLG